MNIYLAHKDVKYSSLLSDIDKPWIFDSDRNLELLAEKEFFLIDVFHTFIEPAVDRFDSMTLERLGVVAMIKEKPVRAGFYEFLEHYNGLGKKIAIHSDAFSKKEFEEAAEHWNFGDTVKAYFDWRYFDKKLASVDIFIKDFTRMIDELGVLKEDVLVIGDGASDIRPAIKGDIDILLVPTYGRFKRFDYKSLIK